MDILYLLIPLSAVLVLVILGVFGWAVNSGQFDDVEQEGRRILDDAPGAPAAEAAPSTPRSPEPPPTLSSSPPR